MRLVQSRISAGNENFLKISSYLRFFSVISPNSTKFGEMLSFSVNQMFREFWIPWLIEFTFQDYSMNSNLLLHVSLLLMGIYRKLLQILKISFIVKFSQNLTKYWQILQHTFICVLYVFWNWHDWNWIFNSVFKNIQKTWICWNAFLLLWEYLENSFIF